MTTYLVLVPPAREDGSLSSVADAQFVPESRAFWALVLPLPWLLWNRLWWPAMFYVLVSVIFAMALTLEGGILASLLTFVPGLFLLFEGHELKRKMFERRGWKQTALVEGEDQIEAEIRFFSGLDELPERPDAKIQPKQVLQPVDTGISFFASPEAY